MDRRTPGGSTVKRFLVLISLLLGLVVTGTVGYHLIEGWPLFDSLYMATITLTTIGFSEVHRLSDGGRTFTIGLALVGISTLGYVGGALVAAVVGGQIRAALGRQRMERTLAKLENHIVVCGYGRMGRLICQEFSTLGQPFVVIDRDQAVADSTDDPNRVPLHGDATSDEILRQAGIERARALVAVLGSDADNLFITMSARLMNDRLFIVARADGEAAERKLARAGANRVVSPYAIGGHRIAQAVLRPAVVEFIDKATRSGHLDLQIEETLVEAASPIAGRTVQESRLRQELGVIVVAIRKPSGQMVFNPGPDEKIEQQDVLITIGHRDRLDKLEAIGVG